MAATHCRIIADIPLSKEQKLGAVLKATDAAMRAWQAAVVTLGGAVEIDAVTVAKRKAVAEIPAEPPAPEVDIASFAELGYLQSMRRLGKLRAA